MRCDQRDLRTVDKWHRFVGDAGTAMPTSCVPKNHCGTHAPGWLESGHPSVGQGSVTGKVCFHWSSKCCHWSVNIKVRNCGDFYVYKLPKTPYCSLRYCAEKKGNVLFCRAFRFRIGESSCVVVFLYVIIVARLFPLMVKF